MRIPSYFLISEVKITKTILAEPSRRPDTRTQELQRELSHKSWPSTHLDVFATDQEQITEAQAREPEYKRSRQPNPKVHNALQLGNRLPRGKLPE
jgi:hypothetical protein